MKRAPMNNPVARAVAIMGGAGDVSKALGVSRQFVYDVIDRGHYLTEDVCRKILMMHHLSGVPLLDLLLGDFAQFAPTEAEGYEPRGGKRRS